MKYTQVKPCDNCPFRTDVEPYISAQRIEQILETILDRQQDFTCHKGLGEPEEARYHCAGAMIFLEHMEQPNQMMRIAARFGDYSRDRLHLDAPVYTDADALLEAYWAAEDS